MREEHKDEPLSLLEVWERFGGAMVVLLLLTRGGAGVDVEGLDCRGRLLATETTPLVCMAVIGVLLGCVVEMGALLGCKIVTGALLASVLAVDV